MTGEVGSARIMGLGGINNSVARDPLANPAGLASRTDSLLTSTYGEGFSGGMADGSLSMTLNNILFKIDYVNIPGIEKCNEAGDEQGETSLNEYYLSAAYGFQLSQSISLGAAVNMHSKSADRQTNFGTSVSFGSIYKLTEKVSLGAVVENLGGASSLSEQGGAQMLPATLRTGFQVSPINSVHLVGGGAFAGTLRPEWSLGAEYELVRTESMGLILRTGYDGSRQSYGPLSVGFGVNIQGICQIDYANNMHPVLGSTSVFSLTFNIRKLFNQSQ